MGLRLAEVGVFPGAEIEILQSIPFGGPVVFERQGFVLALRRGDAEAVQVREANP